jgi:hypothetical protein
MAAKPNAAQNAGTTAGKAAEQSKADTAKTETSTETAAARPAFAFKVKRNLTLPLIKPKLDEPIYIRFTEAMQVGKEIDKTKDAAITAVVTNLETGELNMYLVPAVLQGVLHDDYNAPKYGSPEKGKPVVEKAPKKDPSKPEAYIGLCFAITTHPKPSGKAYHPMTVLEIEDPTAAQ